MFLLGNRKYPLHKASSFCFDPPTIYPTSHLGFHRVPYYAGLMLTAGPPAPM